MTAKGPGSAPPLVAGPSPSQLPPTQPFRSETMLPISASEAGRLSFDINRNDILFAAAYGVYGPSWRVEHISGGDTGPATPTLHGPFELYVVNTIDYTVVLNVADTLIPDTQWRYVAPWYPNELGDLAPIPLDENDVIRSDYDGTRFVVRTVHQDAHNTVGICELL